jgi:hypothetical protein
MRRTRLVLNGRTVRTQPPVVGDYCWPGSSGKTDRPCFYESASCATTGSPCGRCGFQFCENHFKAHIRKLPPVPPDFFKGLVKRIHAALGVIAEHPRAHMPYIEVVTREDRRGDD